jgi:hypothetical protein
MSGNDPLHHPLIIQATLDWPEAELRICLEHRVMWANTPADKIIKGFMGKSAYVGGKTNAYRCLALREIADDIFTFSDIEDCHLEPLENLHDDGSWQTAWLIFRKRDWQWLDRDKLDNWVRRNYKDEWKQWRKQHLGP